jgi:hypothetical protein
VIELKIPDTLFEQYEWVNVGVAYREALIPASVLNAYLSPARIDSQAVYASSTARV